MTKREAIHIQETIELLISEAICRPPKGVRISLALNGRLRVALGDDYVNFDKQDFLAHYVSFKGFYSELVAIIQRIQSVLEGSADSIAKLVWSYENIKELQD